MGEKKKPGRFTLQFNLEDPQQRTVSELLEQQGRHKAQFITSAVLRYIQCPSPQEHNSGLSTTDEAALERLLLPVLEKSPRFAAAVPCEPPRVKEPPAQAAPAAEPWRDSMKDDALKAISDTLAAFQKG